MIETAQAFGVDIGGSGIKAAPVNLEKGEFAEPRLKILTPEVSTPEAVAAIVRQQLEHFEVPETAPVGIAFPAPIKPGRPLDFMANLDQSWIGVDVTAVFSEACGRPVVVVNDADAAGLAESLYGEARRHRGLVVTVTLGTGIGTALVMDGVLVPNSELGHLTMGKHGEDADKGGRQRRPRRNRDVHVVHGDLPSLLVRAIVPSRADTYTPYPLVRGERQLRRGDGVDVGELWTRLNGATRVYRQCDSESHAQRMGKEHSWHSPNR